MRMMKLALAIAVTLGMSSAFASGTGTKICPTTGKLIQVSKPGPMVRNILQGKPVKQRPAPKTNEDGARGTNAQKA